MNFRWSNICVLQCLVVLNVDSLKLVPADRTIIKQNGTTRTISRYYLLPHSEDKKQVDIDAEASNDGDFSKFLREFNPKKKVTTKIKQDPKKKTVERYRIYIKRKLKKPKAKVLSKSAVPNSKDKNPNVNSSNKSDGKSVEYIDGYSKRVTKKVPIYKIKTNTTSDDTEEEYILKKKQGELSVAYPKYMIGKKSKGKDGNTEIIEEEDETEDRPHGTTLQLEDDNAFQVLRSNESEFNVKDSTIDLSVEQDAREMVLQTAKQPTKKGLYGDGRQMNQTKDTINKKLIQMGQGKSFTYLTKNNSSDEPQGQTVTKAVQSKIGVPSGGLNQTHLDQLYKELYGEYQPKAIVTAKPGDNDYKLSEEPDSLEETNTQNVKQQTQAPDEDSEFQKLLSALHNTPENFPSQVPQVENDPDTNDYFYKNPLDGKESTNDKSPEDIYEDTKSSQSYNFESNPIPVASYGETIPGSVKTKDFSSSNGRTTNPLENYFQTFHNHNTLFKEPTLNVQSIESVSNTTSNESQYEMPNSKYIETKRKPPYAMHKEISDDSETISNQDFLNYTQKDDKYLGTTTDTLPLSTNQEGAEYSKTARSPISKGYSQESADYLESIKTPQTPKRNQTKVMKITTYKDYYATSTENSDSIMYPYLSDNLTDLDYFGILKKPTYKYKSGYLNLATENTAAVNKSTLIGYNQQDIEEKPLPLGYNQTDDEYLNIFKKPYYNPESIEYSEGTKYITPLGYFQEDFENVETASQTPFLSGNQTGFNYSKIIEKPSYIGSNSTTTESRNYNQEGLEYLDTIRNPHILGVNKTDDIYPKIIKRPTYKGYGSTITESPSNSQEDLVYLDTIRNPLLLDNNKTDTEYSINENKLAYESYNTTSTERSETTINPLPLGYNQSDVEYIETIRYPPYLSNYETEVEYSKNIEKPAIKGYQASTEKSDTTINLPPEGYNYGDEYVVTPRNPPSLGNYQEGIQYSKIVKKPTYKEYTTGNTEPSETIKNYELSEGISNSSLPSEVQADVEYSEHINHPFYLSYNQASTEYSKTVRSPAYTGINDDVETISEPSHLVFNEESSKYSEKTISPPYLNDNQGEFEYTKTVRSPPYIGYYQENTEYANTVKSPLAFNQENDEDSEAIKLPPSGYYETEYQEYTDKPVYLGHNVDNPEYSEVINSFITEYANTVKSPLAFNQSNDDDSETVMKPLSLDNTGSKYSQTVKNIPYLIYNQASTGYSITIKSPPYIGYYQENSEYKETTNNPHLLDYNQGSSEYIEPFKNPIHLSYDQANDEYSETAIYPAIMDNNQASTEYYINAKEPPLTVYGQMPNIKYSDNSRFPYGVNHLSQNTENDENSRIPSYGVHHISQSTEFSKNIKSPPYKVKYPAQSTEYYENSRYPPYGAYQQSQNAENSEYPKLSKLTVHNNLPMHVYSENSRNPPHSVYHHAVSTEYSENASELPYGAPNPRNPLYSVHHKSPSIEYSENPRNPPYSVHHKSPSIEYSEYPRNPPYSVHHKSPGTEYSENSRNPPYATHNQLSSIEYPSNTEYPLYANYQPMQSLDHNENSRNPPYADHGETSGTEYSEISRNPPPVISTEHNILPTVKNIDSSSVVTQIITEQENSTEDIELRDGADYEWSVYKDILAGSHDSRKPKIEIGTNLIQIGTGNEAVNQRPGNNINLAKLCPECFKKLSTSAIHQEAAGVKDQASVLQLLQNSFSQLNIQNDYLHHSPQGPPLQNNQDHSVIDFLKKLESHNHPQPLYLNTDKDQNLYKVLELVLKGDAETSVGNVKATTIPSIKLFTVENLRQVLEALERSMLTGADKETANLHKIIKLIFDTALALTAKSKNGAIWYAQLNSVAANPTQTYVYNLIQQTWLQEIMWQLANNNYNLNVIRNPKWAAYLGAWQLPGKLANTNVQYYDHSEVILQNAHVNGADFYTELSSINIQGDAGAILALLQKYLLYTQLQYGQGSVEYFQKQNEILTRISAFLRERGYPLHVIEALIRKLYTALNANRGQMLTVARPACLAGH